MSAPVPDLPVLPEDDSMLTRKFGREVANYFSGSPLNRVSFLRTNYGFLAAAFAHPTARILPMNGLAPLARDPTQLAYVARADVAPLTGDRPFAWASEQKHVAAFNSATEAYRSIVLFLGLDEKDKDAPDAFDYHSGEYRGTPYFAVDVTPRGDSAETAKTIIEHTKEKGLTFLAGVRHVTTLNAPEAAIYAQARALLDWNARNPFCGGCGRPTMSVNAGTKRVCPPADWAGVKAAADEGGDSATPVARPDCPTRHGVSNLCFPRTDPTVIMAIVSADGTRILLGRNKRFPPLWYSTLAGFLEPGESVEEAVRRETWEESGVTVGRVVLHSSQPWPYPANLMLGAIGQALPGAGEEIHLGHDQELDDARWFTLDEVRAALLNPGPPLGEEPKEGEKIGPLRIPPQTAIANRLMDAVCSGYLGAASKM